MFQIIPLLVFAFALCSDAAIFTDCGSKVGKITNITVSNCEENDATCILRRGTDASIHIDFKPDVDISRVKTVVHGVIAGLPIPFPIPGADSCSNPKSGLICPLKNGESYHYEATLAVLKIYPTIPVTVMWELRSEQGEDIVCVYIPTRIQ